MQQDYLHFLAKDTGRNGGKAPSSSGRRRVDLDLIYQQYLKKWIDILSQVTSYYLF